MGGRGPPTLTLFGENVCENERVGSRGGEHVPEKFICRSADAQTITIHGNESGKIM